MFRYFPDNYGWSLSVLIGMAMGAELGEIDRICDGLRVEAARPAPKAEIAWLRAWATEGGRLRIAAELEEAAGHGLSAAARYRRAATYFLLGERQVGQKSAESLEVYRAGLAAFRSWAALSGAPIEFVDVPYGRSALPALFLPAPGGRRAPCVIHFDGLDVMKEIICLMHADGLPARGVSVLIVDHPGVGEALRLRDLYLTHRTEEPAAACLDYLAGRPEVDFDRTGIMALSLGGYYAPRAAALEPRLAFCVAWGAMQAAVIDGSRSGVTRRRSAFGQRPGTSCVA